MNDVLVTANAAVVSKLLVIAPYPADGYKKPSSGASQGDRSQQFSFTAKTAVSIRRLSAVQASRISKNPSDQSSKGAFTSAAFVQSGAERVLRFRTGIFGIAKFYLFEKRQRYSHFTLRWRHRK